MGRRKVGHLSNQTCWNHVKIADQVAIIARIKTCRLFGHNQHSILGKFLRLGPLLIIFTIYSNLYSHYNF